MFRQTLPVLLSVTLGPMALANEPEPLVIVVSSHHAPSGGAAQAARWRTTTHQVRTARAVPLVSAGPSARVIELLPTDVAHDLLAASSRLVVLPRVDLCIWNSQLDSGAEAMWVERISREHAGCRVVDVAGNPCRSHGGHREVYYSITSSGRGGHFSQSIQESP